MLQRSTDSERLWKTQKAVFWYGKMIEVSYIENIAYEQYTQMCVLVRKDYRILLRREHSPISVNDTN